MNAIILFKKEKVMNSIKIIIVRLLLFLYLSSSYLSVTHIHNDGLTQQSDCKICIVVKNLNSADVPNDALAFLSCDFCYEPIFSEEHQNTFKLLKGFNANAPPLS